MPTPKKKISRSRRDKRRHDLNNQLAIPTAATCPSCSSPKRPHRICSCGFYKGRQVLPARDTAARA